MFVIYTPFETCDILVMCISNALNHLFTNKKLLSIQGDPGTGDPGTGVPRLTLLWVFPSLHIDIDIYILIINPG